MVPWRQSASLVLLGSKQANKLNPASRFDYATLLLKRSPKMRFAPDASAFPGGKLDRCDLSADWAAYLSSSVSLDRFSKKVADIYQDIDHPYPGLAFRLCAIRETFEETGLLLAKARSFSQAQRSPVFNLPKNLVNQWREKIRQDGSQFLHMCKEIQVEPDVNSLFDWNEYLAAAIAKVRFDTIFYLVPLPELYPCVIAADDTETASANWFEPDTAMLNYRQGSLNLLPPQIYELSRLANFRQLSQLVDLLVKRDKTATYHVQRLLSIYYKLPDAMILLMPGDDHYPIDASYTTPVLSSDRPLAEFQSKNQNRLVMRREGSSRTWEVQYQVENDREKVYSDVQPLTDGWEKQ